MLLSLLVLSLTFLDGAQSFLPTPALTRRQRLHFLPVHSSNDDNLDDMRRLLEASWNSDTMGAVPTNPEAAADAAATSLRSAMNNGESLFFVDLLLPSYDITQGSNIYDDVLAVEFCIALSKALEEKSCILVRDEKTRNTVGRVLEARQRNRLEKDEEEVMGDDHDEDDDDDDEEEEEDEPEDFADLDSATPSSTKAGATLPQTDDVDAFREQLMAKWDDLDAVSEKPDKSKNPDVPPEAKNTSKPPAKTAAELVAPGFYRLASLFGDTKISTGADMMDQVIKAVAANGQPIDDEDTIIILSAVQKDEMIAVRSLAAKYKGKKNIVLVNCQLDPIPRELIRANTVYSILPLVAKPVVSEQNFFGSGNPQEDKAPPKIVVLRRYPKDWEVFVDADGNGFELVDIAKASQVGKKGPPMEWIARCIKRHMESKLGG